MSRRSRAGRCRATPASRGATRCWRCRPSCLRGSGLRADRAAIEEAFRLTGFFFSRHVYEPRGFGEPEARAAFLGALRRSHARLLAGNGEDAA